MLGVSLALHWPIGLIFAAVWLAGFGLTRISSVGGMSAALSAPVAAFALGREALLAPLAAMAAILLWKHRLNIARLLRGDEPRFGASGKG
jgi:glycerol-3-phosphate acyltransferase PlsY